VISGCAIFVRREIVDNWTEKTRSGNFFWRSNESKW